MERACFATWAELLHFKTVWIVTTVLLGDVVAVLAVLARQGDLGANVTCLGHGLSLSNSRA